MILLRVDNKLINLDNVNSIIYTPADDNSFSDKAELMINFDDRDGLALSGKEAERVWDLLKEKASPV